MPADPPPPSRLPLPSILAAVVVVFSSPVLTRAISQYNFLIPNV